MDYIICHYAEIGLKGGNRRFFEEKLVENIKTALPPHQTGARCQRHQRRSQPLLWCGGEPRASFEFVKRISGRLLIKLTAEGAENKTEIETALKTVFGIANFSFAGDAPLTIEAIKKKAVEVLQGKRFKTFKIATQRSDKNFPLTSTEVNEKVGEFVLEKLKIKVDLEKPDITLFIEIVEKCVFLYTEKMKGPGGLPMGTGGKAVALISGGIDSPVAAFLAMKRGVEIVFLHFHSYPYTNKASVEKVQKLVRHLSWHQQSPKLYLAPFGDIQKEILLKTPAKLRVVLYRRMMIRIAQVLSEKEKALALVTGESIGQVASQTLENMAVIEKAVSLPILRPLIGWDKEEIIKKAKEIGTFEISSLPDQDCCSRFVPEHPETKARLSEVLAVEKKLEVEKLVRETQDKMEISVV